MLHYRHFTIAPWAADFMIATMLSRFVDVADTHEIGRPFNGSFKQILLEELVADYQGLRVQGKFGEGLAAAVPWIGFFGYKQVVAKGIYPVYLYFKGQGKLMLAYGVSEKNAPDTAWSGLQHAVTVRDYFANEQLPLPARYGNSYVAYVYDAHQLPDEEVLQSELMEVVTTFKNIFANRTNKKSMTEQVLIYEVKSSASSNARLLFSQDEQSFYWNDRAFRKLGIGDFVFLVNRDPASPFVLFCRMEVTDIPTSIAEGSTRFADDGKTFSVSGEWERFVRLHVIEKIVPPDGWSWKTLGSTEMVYLHGPNVNPENSANRLQNIQQLRELSDDDEYNMVLNASENNFVSSGRRPEFDAELRGDNLQALLNLSEFVFEKGREQLEFFESISGPPDLFETYLRNFDEANTTYSRLISNLAVDSPLRDILVRIGKLVSYCDRNAANKNEYNEYADKRTLARSGVRQTEWVRNLLKYKAANHDLSVLPANIRNAIAYLKNPTKEITILSENHREMVSRNLLSLPVYDKASFVSQLIKYFEPYDIRPSNEENLTRVLSSLLYSSDGIRRLWQDSNTVTEGAVPSERQLGIVAELHWKHEYRSILTAIRAKPFVLLAGLSGTGKSRLVRTLAFQTCRDSELQGHPTKPGNFELIPVRPNWHDSAELMGYVSRINREKYITTAFLKFVAKAWRYEDIPFFLCLDEMNLAPVEQYFAEYLSLLETRSFINGKLVTDFLIAKSDFENPALYDQIRTDLGLSGDARFSDGIQLPSNLVVIGTVNMDETTHSFSRKVLDRAMTIEMNKVYLDRELTNPDRAWSYPDSYLGGEDVLGNFTGGSEVYGLFPDAARVVEHLLKLNDVLEGSPFKIAYRVRDEFLIYTYFTSLISDKPPGWLNSALDEMTSMKVLSRIEGDEHKTEEIIGRLTGFLHADFEISKGKLDEMSKRLKSGGYTSFWA